MRIAFTLDGTPQEVEADETTMVVDLLRELGRTSVRQTCGIGVCGACTVLVDDEPISGCLMLAGQVEGRALATVEGLPEDDPVLLAFTQAHAYQCGWCTPGMVLTVKAMLADNPRVDRSEAAEALGGNLCRCGCYARILDAVEIARCHIMSSTEGSPDDWHQPES